MKAVSGKEFARLLESKSETIEVLQWMALGGLGLGLFAAVLEATNKQRPRN